MAEHEPQPFDQAPHVDNLAGSMMSAVGHPDALQFASTRWRRSGRKVAGSERAPLWRILLCRAVVSRVDSGSSGDPRVRAALTVQGRRVRFRAFSLLRPSLFSGRVCSSSLPVGIRVLRGLRV